MRDGGFALVVLSVAIFLAPYILGLARENIQPGSTNLSAALESILLLASECYIVIHFWFPLHGGSAGIEFDTAKIIQAICYSCILIIDVIVMRTRRKTAKLRR
jgi:hypothetical protein